MSWKSYTVKELVDLSIIERPMDGNHGEIHPKGSDFIESGIPFIMATDIKNSKLDLINCSFISREQAKKLRKGFSYTNDVLLTHKASIGRTAIVPILETDYIMLTPQVTYYRVKDSSKLSYSFLRYYFDSSEFQQIINSYANSGSTRAYIGITEQLNLPIVLPPVKIQNSISSILTSLDNKIELNLQMNKTLETMAQTIFKEWFVNFNFPGFDGELLDGLPEGWREVGLDDVIELIIDHRGKTPLKLGGEWVESGIPAISAKNVKDGKLVNLDDVGYVDDELYQKWMKEKLKPFDILLTSEAPLGEVAILVSDTDYCLSQRLFAIRTNDRCNATFLYFFLRSETGKANVQKRATGSTVVGIRQSELRLIEVLLADYKVQELFSDVVTPLLIKMDENFNEIKTLTQMRDNLLSKLMTGKIEVKADA